MFNAVGVASVVLGTQLADGLGRTPHLALTERLELLLQTHAVVGLGVGIDGNLCLIATLDRSIELLYDRLAGIVEGTHPV